MEKIIVGLTYTRDELKERGVSEVGTSGDELIISDGARRYLWNPNTNKITFAFDDDKRYATF